MKRILVLLTLLLAVPIIAQAELIVHYLDVGQGDATLILCDGEAMLIDGGPTSASQLVYSYLKQHTDHLEYMVATHPHEDHIGGLAAALNAVPVDIIYSPVAEWGSSCFSDMKEYADLQGAPIVVPYEGDSFQLGSSSVTVLHCWPEAWDPNDMSIVLRIDYGNTAFIFMGDAEVMSEYMILDSGLPLQADVLKVGHHGSASSSSQEFIAAVDPRYAVISCGRDNSYNHPHPATLEVLEGIRVLRTDELGTIIIRSDGQTISVDGYVEKEESPETVYIGNRNSMKFHYPDCPGVKETSPKNRIPLSSREEAISIGYTPCGECHP